MKCEWFVLCIVTIWGRLKVSLIRSWFDQIRHNNSVNLKWMSLTIYRGIFNQFELNSSRWVALYFFFFRMLSGYVEFDGYYLESDPCLVCNNPEVPFQVRRKFWDSVAFYVENKVAAMRKNQDLFISMSCTDVGPVPVTKSVTEILSAG